jgi:hypothetical protein
MFESLHPIQIQRFREMSFAEKWAVAQGLWLMARTISLPLNPAMCDADAG